MPQAQEDKIRNLMKFGVSLLEYGAVLKQDEIFCVLNRSNFYNNSLLLRSPKEWEGLKHRLELPSSPSKILQQSRQKNTNKS